MTLVEHLRELRNRIFKAALAIGLGAIVGWIYYDQLFAILIHPFDQILAQAQEEGRTVVLALTGITDAFSLKFKLSLVFGVVLSAPIWLYQMWRFVAPGLEGREKRWGYGFVLAATPMFLAGMAMGYFVLPQVLGLFIGLTPEGVDNIISLEFYLSFFLQMLLFFGVSFVVPLVLLMLNFAGVLTGRRLLSWWRFLLLGSFLFSAVATPSGDIQWMILFALPMLVLFAVAILISLLNDRRRRRKRPADERYEDWDDDAPSPAPAVEHDASDDTPSPLDGAR